eukprot:9499076-Pyramimonas_sp.AAC.2
MDGAHDGHAACRQRLDALHQLQRRRAVKPCQRERATSARRVESHHLTRSLARPLLTAIDPFGSTADTLSPARAQHGYMASVKNW